MSIFLQKLNALLSKPIAIKGNYGIVSGVSEFEAQQQTNDAFSNKWENYKNSAEKDAYYAAQKKWYLELYGFDSEQSLADYLSGCPVILDAGCGLGYKAAWFAELAPESLVVAMDFSEVAAEAARNYAHLPNLYFLRGDIAAVPFIDQGVDYVSCDQVIMHTEQPEETFAELVRIMRPKGGQFSCYFYAKKALPRELLDEHFRTHCKNLTSDDLWAMSEQLTELGKRLSALKVNFECPDIPALGIKGGTYDIQRFIYWNFLKCYWNEALGRETSTITNFDWYSPTNAYRYSEKEVRNLVEKHGLVTEHFHREEACYSGRFVRQ
jgi:SAM-dependent methyltransferase